MKRPRSHGGLLPSALVLALAALLLPGPQPLRGRSAPPAGPPLAPVSPGAAPAADPQTLPTGPPPAPNACELIDRDPAQARRSFVALGRALTASDPAPAAGAAAELRACTRERSRRLAVRRIWTPGEAETLAALLLADPERFVADEPFRRRILALLPEALDPQSPAALRDDLLAELNQLRGFDFAASDALEAAWGRTPRRAAERRIDLPAQGPGSALRFDSDTAGRLAVSIYSLPSLFFEAETALAFLQGVAALDPEREILVLTDLPLTRALGPRLRDPKIRLLETYGRAYTPWPRDPFSLVRDAEGRLIALARPNLQPGREEDANLAAELVQNLPADLDARLGGKGGAAWAVAPTPFHNGQVLLAKDAAWMTIHALEPRVLALLGVDRVPVESFGTAPGIDRYLQAVDRAARELAALYGRPVRFIHPLPRTGPLAERTALLRTLGGAAGYDLDSLVTLVPVRGPEAAPHGAASQASGEERLAALVADPRLGRELVAQAPAEELASLRAGFALAPEGEALRAALLAAEDAPAPRALAAFLDLAAKHLEGEGFAVRRLPLLSVPVPLLRDAGGLSHPEFLLTWNNVVVEQRGGPVRAEGFSSLFPPGDRAARETFAALGVRLDLLPPLVRSIVLNGGYRCASNHLRVHLRVGGGG